MFNYKYNDLQRAWLDDLLTTTEPQTDGVLHQFMDDELTGKKRGFCCLGRACVVAKLPWKCHNHRTLDYGQGDSEEVPPDLVNKLHLNGRSGPLRQPVVGYDGTKHHHLTGLNDNAGWTFKQIAEYIEANPDNVWADYGQQKAEYDSIIRDVTGLDTQPEPGTLSL